jgi:4-amino-4-deoxy-L-arabinose transferase-like glycosyltransferase
VLAAWVTIRLLRSEDHRWWLALGAVVGLGMMTKYTMAFLLAGIVLGLVLTRPRWLLNKWLWCGAAVVLLIFLPNLIWQVRQNFITLDFLRFIHARDVRLGRADGFLPAQFWAMTNCVTVPIWIGGLYFLFFEREGKRYRRCGRSSDSVPQYLIVTTTAHANQRLKSVSAGAGILAGGV